MTSPYEGIDIAHWRERTLELIAQHPLKSQELYEIVHKAWLDIFQSGIGSKPFRIGVDLFPAPQIMGFFLHELIALELQYRYSGVWRRDRAANEKDLVYIPNDDYSIEIKTSSSGRNIFGNRSYAQVGKTSKKSRTGYYLAINFEKLSALSPVPKLALIRFGWLDHEDWIGQYAATGQKARLSPVVQQNKLIELPIAE